MPFFSTPPLTAEITSLPAFSLSLLSFVAEVVVVVGGTREGCGGSERAETDVLICTSPIFLSSSGLLFLIMCACVALCGPYVALLPLLFALCGGQNEGKVLRGPNKDKNGNS